ncbi:hypothetical protein [Bacillus cereus group sp. BfR-BA-01524]|uniref:hypothetical protein n=1 Tax=Bacillus cereus group sp. BfR-BA-01524 TaxID=2920372 RepID=UPI001F576270
MGMESLQLCLTVEGEVTLQEIEEILAELGFERRFNNLHWYKWFDKNQSTMGCDFSIDSKESVIINGHKVRKFYFKSITYPGRSYMDLEMQNNVISRMQQKFGGELFDENGVSSSFIENTLPQLTSTEIACEIEFGRFLSNVGRFNRLIEEVDEELLEGYQSATEPGMKDFFTSSLSSNESLLRNNTLLPFAVATLEDFLKNLLAKNLETNETARDIIFQNDRKIKYSEIKEIISGEKSLIDMEMNFYNFQNLESANGAYKKFLDFDMFKEVLNKKHRSENEEVTVLSVLSELIAIRHNVIHEAKLDYTLGKKKMKQYYAFLLLFGGELMEKLRGKLGLRDATKELNVEVIKQ